MSRDIARAYRGVAATDTKRFRMVAVYNEDEEKYHLYITNILTEMLNAEEIAKLYSARWGVEILFKNSKANTLSISYPLQTRWSSKR
ncbi:MAG: transposase [Methanothrix sp.]|uniref:transposase n=1 Tax=Methanothrix sp. TaxID=90426 RepID=UPI0025D205A1|nr:transposase [Methanothrix sp.]MCQ8903646.1 transposase [Methanothrix sp.]